MTIFRYLFAILGCIAATLAHAEQDVGGGITLFHQVGQCTVKLNDTDLGCVKGALYSRLGNGRHLINTPTRDIASIGFAGQKLEVDRNSSVLWLDGAYINQQRLEADGQCSFTRKPTGSVELDCRAVLRDGRKLVARLENSTQSERFLGLATVEQQASRKESCPKTVAAHGMLSRAQFQCKFRKYNTAMIEAARRCVQDFPDLNLEERLKHGMSLFDAHVKDKGLKAMCRTVLADFPDVLGK